MGRNRDPIYAPDGRTWYETALAEAEKRGKLEVALTAILPFADNSDSPGGCDGTQPECPHCAAIAGARNALQ